MSLRLVDSNRSEWPRVIWLVFWYGGTREPMLTCELVGYGDKFGVTGVMFVIIWMHGDRAISSIHMSLIGVRQTRKDLPIPDCSGLDASLRRALQLDYNVFRVNESYRCSYHVAGDSKCELRVRFTDKIAAMSR